MAVPSTASCVLSGLRVARRPIFLIRYVSVVVYQMSCKVSIGRFSEAGLLE